MESENRRRGIFEGLSQKQEILLMRYSDGEGSILVKWEARRLIRTHPAAQAFIDDLNLCGEIVRRRGGCVEQLLPPSWSVASGVHGDIEKQECFKQAIGAPKLWRLFSPEMVSRVGWGATGALTAASVILVMAPPSGVPQTKNGGINSSSIEVDRRRSGLAVQPAALGVDRLAGGGGIDDNRKYRLLFGEARGGASQHGVEWYRSGGQLQFIGSPGARGPVMWVMRNGSARRRMSQPKVVPTVAFVGGTGGAQGEIAARGGK